MLPKVTVLFVPAFTVGNGFTVTLILFVLVHPYVSVSVSVYVVLDTGLTSKVDVLEEEPAGDDVHEYKFPGTPVTPKVIELPMQTLLLIPTFAGGKAVTAIWLPVPVLLGSPGVGKFGGTVSLTVFW